MIDDEREDEEERSEASTPGRFAFPGMGALDRWRGRRPPRIDPNKPRMIYQPHFRVVTWQGSPDAHATASCEFPYCKVDAHGEGTHSEARPAGFSWEETYFPTLADALQNQAFATWYQNGGQEVMERGRMEVRDPQYFEGREPPLPRFNFLIAEHQHEMTETEIRAYFATGEVPKRLRRRGRAKSPRRRSPTEGV